MQALNVRIDRKRVYGDRRLGLRDAALLALLQAGMTHREVARARGRQFVQLDNGDLIVRDRTGQRTDLIRLAPHQTAILLEYLEDQRIWGEPERHLFTGRGGRALSTVRIKKIAAIWRARA